MTIPRTDEWLLKYSGEHLAYEIEMLLQCELRMRTHWARPVDRFWSNVLIEARALHARNVIDFLYPTGGKRATDVSAVEFAHGWNESASKNIADLRNRVHKEIAHLTEDRKVKDKEWELLAFSSLWSALGTFVEQSSDARLHNHVATLISRAEAHGLMNP